MERGYVQVLASVAQFGNPGKCTPESMQLGQYRNGFRFRFNAHQEGFYHLHQKGATTTRPFPFLVSTEEGADEVSPIACLGLYGHRNLSEVGATEAKFIFKHSVSYIEEEVMGIPENSSD